MWPRFRYDQLMDLGWRRFIPLRWPTSWLRPQCFGEKLDDHQAQETESLGTTLPAAVIGGFKVTGAISSRKKVTMQYPEEKWVVPEGYRGAPYLVSDQDGRPSAFRVSCARFVLPA